MANKTYIVVKDGEELKELKSLTAAKKLADTEGAEVFCDGKCTRALSLLLRILSKKQLWRRNRSLRSIPSPAR